MNPVIILPVDHGASNFELPDAKEKIGHLPGSSNAIYLLAEDPHQIYPSISSVNTFRLVFNHVSNNEPC